MRAQRRVYSSLFVLGAAWGGWGCASTPQGGAPCQEPPPFTLQIQASERLNPDDLGRALPTMVRVFQMEDWRRLESVDFHQAWQQPEEVLEGDLLKVDALTIDPGQTLAQPIERNPRAKYVVVLGVFRHPTDQNWRAVQPLQAVPPEKCGKQAARQGSAEPSLRFSLDGYRVEASRPGGGQ